MSQPKPKETRAYLYTVSHDKNFLTEYFGVSQEIISKFDPYYDRIYDDPRGCIVDLIDLCQKYPEVPQIKNILLVAYQLAGNVEKAKEVNNWLISEHPDYLFGKINKAYEYLSQNKPEMVAELLGEWMEIKELYPKREVFHISEVMAFNRLVFQYHMARGKIDVARSILETMETVKADHPDAQFVRNQLLKAGKPLKKK
jgi:hypothetical protein